MSQNSTITILHADDVDKWRRRVVQMLTPTYRVESVADCAEILPRIGEGGIDLVILDHLMPGDPPLDTGIDVCRHLRANFPDLPVMIFTGAWQGVATDRAELEASAQAPVVFKEALDTDQDNLLERVTEMLN